MDELKDKRQQWFYLYKERLERIVEQFAKEDVNFTCPCCGYPMLPERGAYEICKLCDWEDDGQDDPRADEIWGGPNGDYSLTEARHNFKKYLTKYRPDDDRGYPRHLQKMAAKRELISIYDQMLKAQGSYNFRNEFERLRKKAERLGDDV
jgi:hypothetical protein